MSADYAIQNQTTNSSRVSNVTIASMQSDWADATSVKQDGYWSVFERRGTISKTLRDIMNESSRSILSMGTEMLADYLNNNIVNNEIYAMLDNMNNQAEQTNQTNQSNENPDESDDSEIESEESDVDEPDLEVPEVPDNSDINNRLNDKVSFTINKTFPLSNTPHYLEKRTNRKFCEFIGLPRLSSQSNEDDSTNKPNKGWAGQKQGKLKGNQRSGAADAIRNRNSEKKSEKEDEIISALLADVENLKKSIPQGVCKSNESIQLTITRLMGHINAITNNHSTVSDEKKLDLYFGVNKIIDAISEVEVRNHIDNSISVLGQDQSVIDLIQVFNKFCTAVYPDITVPVLRAADEFPKLFQFTSYDDFLPATKIKLFDSQTKMLSLLAQQLCASSTQSSTGLLSILNTVPGQGKTTLVLAIAKMIETSALSRVMYKPRMGRKGNSRPVAKSKVGGRTLKMLYVTPKTLLPVAKQVGSLLYESIPFGIAYSEIKNGIRKCTVSENYNCYRGKRNITYTPPVVVLCSPSTATEILKNNIRQKELAKNGINTEADKYEAKTDYIMFYDEPTAIGMDQNLENNNIVNEFAELIKVMPKWSVLSCATLKNINNYIRLCQIFRSKYPRAILETVNNSKIPIGASVMNFNGQVMLPHDNCTTDLQLARIIQKLKDEMILQKLYTHRIVHTMYMRIRSMNLNIPPNLHFGSYITANEISQDSIQKLAIKYLEFILQSYTTDNSVIQRFCSYTYNNTPFNTENIISNLTHLKSQTLVVCSNPVSHFKNSFIQFYHNILAHFGAENFSGIEASHRKKITEWEHQFEEAKKAELARKSTSGKKKGRDSAEGTNKKSNNFDISCEGNIDVRMEKWKSDNPCPTLNIPLRFCIRSLSQTNEKTRKMIDFCSEFYDQINPCSGNEETDDILKVMLAAGVGVYSSHLDDSYLKLITEQMELGNMAFIFVNDDICYGVNYPIENIVILDTPLMVNRSVNTLLQLISRAGRKGKSDKANIWMSEPVLNRLRDYISNPDFFDIEMHNINRACEIAMRN